MLSQLSIKNFAIIKNQSLNFTSGFNVLIGETGAGKSIIIDALNFALGEKANKDNIRKNETQMSVKATFENYNNLTKQILDNFDIPQDDVLIISRTFTLEGKSSCKVNGETVTLTMLKQIAETLVDSYGQHDNVELLKISNHIKLLDASCNHEIENIKNNISALLKQLSEINNQIETLGGSSENRERLIDLLSYQIDEIENAQLQKDEEEELKEKLAIASNAENLLQKLSDVSNILTSSRLEETLTPIQSVISYDNNLEDAYQRLSSAIIEIEDINEFIKEYISKLSFDEKEIKELDTRLDNIKLLKRKYGQSYEDIMLFLKNSKQELYNLQNSEIRLAELNKQKKDIVNNLYDYSIKLHTIRQQSAKIIEKQILSELMLLGMKNAKFVIQFAAIPNIDEAKFSKNGLDNVEFLFSANLGEEPKSLAKIISGGEMSRFMLAVKNVLNNKDTISTLVFDEIDSGISGEIGSMVAQRIAKLSKYYQILCITHLQQVTAMADNFILITKHIVDGQTESAGTSIYGEEITNYIATLSGQGTTQTSIANANELLAWAKHFKGQVNNI